MSWWDSLSGSVSDGLGYIESLLGGSGTPSATTPSTTTPSTGGGGLFSDGNLIQSVLKSGLSLAGTYYKQSQEKSLAEQYAVQKKAEMEAQLKLAALRGGGGGGGGGNPDARRALMAQMYSNWADRTVQSGQIQGQAAIETGKMAIDPIIARLGRL